MARRMGASYRVRAKIPLVCQMTTLPSEVGRGGAETGRVFSEPAKTLIAVRAEDTAYRSRPVVVVHLRPLPAPAARLADGADIVLGQKGIQFRLHEAVFLGSAVRDGALRGTETAGMKWDGLAAMHTGFAVGSEFRLGPGTSMEAATLC